MSCLSIFIKKSLRKPQRHVLSRTAKAITFLVFLFSTFSVGCVCDACTFRVRRYDEEETKGKTNEQIRKKMKLWLWTSFLDGMTFVTLDYNSHTPSMSQWTNAKCDERCWCTPQINRSHSLVHIVHQICFATYGFVIQMHFKFYCLHLSTRLTNMKRYSN